MPTIQLYSAWFCPYAQRAWIAAAHKGLQFELLDGISLGEDEKYKKDPTFLHYNPKGLVPTMVDQSRPEGQPKVVVESLTCVEYIDEITPDAPVPSLLTKDPVHRAFLRNKTNWVNQKICSPFYGVMMGQDDADRKVKFAALVEELKAFSKEIKGPFYFGDAMTVVDIALFPWAFRFPFLSEFKGEEYTLDRSDPALANYFAWYDRMLAEPGVKATLADRQKLYDSYNRYAKGTAASQVGEAVRQGKQAHEVQ